VYFVNKLLEEYFVQPGWTLLLLHRVPETCHYIFDNNMNVNRPIKMTFGTLITQSVGH